MDTQYCDKCGLLHDPNDGDCEGCKMVKELKALKDALRAIRKDTEWVRHTYQDKLKFGMPEEQAIKSREMRYNGVFMTTLDTIRKVLGDEDVEDEL